MELAWHWSDIVKLPSPAGTANFLVGSPTQNVYCAIGSDHRSASAILRTNRVRHSNHAKDCKVL
jgi:hypothetical protein